MNLNPAIKEKIIAAADALSAEGIEHPTNDQVRERMGGGSLSHISPAMREWRAARKVAYAAALEMPADLKKAIESAVGQVWITASKLASATVEAVKQETDTAIKAATQERDEALSEITRLENKIEALEKAQIGKEQEVSQLKTQWEQTLHQNTQLTTEKASLVARVDGQGEQIKDLKTDLKEARSDNKALQAELIKIAQKAQEQE